MHTKLVHNNTFTLFQDTQKQSEEAAKPQKSQINTVKVLIILGH